MSNSYYQIRAWTLGELRSTTDKPVPARPVRYCPRCGCKLNQYTPWSQALCCPCAEKEQTLPLVVQRILAIDPRCAWCERTLDTRNSNRQVYCSARCAEGARRLADQARARERRRRVKSDEPPIGSRSDLRDNPE